MARRLRIAVGALAGALLAVQAFRIDRTNPPVEQDVAAPAGVEALLRRACYNCHSHETVWPWYSHVAPVSWLLAHDVSDGGVALALREAADWSGLRADVEAVEARGVVAAVAPGTDIPWDDVIELGQVA